MSNKFVIGFVFALISSTAFAGPQVSLGFGNTNYLNGATAGTESDNVSLRISNDFNNKGTFGDIIAIQNRSSSNQSLTNQYEIGIGQRLPSYGILMPYARVAAGTFIPSTRSMTNYVGFEPGVILRKDGFPMFAKVDYMWATSTNVDNLDVTLGRVQLGYSLTKEVSVSVRKDWLRGGYQQDMNWLLLGYRF
jgi:hypothetical protein